VTDVLKELLLMTSLIQSTHVVVVDLPLCTLTPTLLIGRIVDVQIFKEIVLLRITSCFVVTIVPFFRIAGFMFVFIPWSFLASVDRWVVALRFILCVVVVTLSVSSLMLVIVFVDAVIPLLPECLVEGDFVFYNTFLIISQKVCSF